MFNGSICDRKVQLSGLLTELLNPRDAGSVSTLMARPDFLQYPAIIGLFYLPH